MLDVKVETDRGLDGGTKAVVCLCKGPRLRVTAMVAAAGWYRDGRSACIVLVCTAETLRTIQLMSGIGNRHKENAQQCMQYYLAEHHVGVELTYF